MPRIIFILYRNKKYNLNCHFYPKKHNIIKAIIGLRKQLSQQNCWLTSKTLAKQPLLPRPIVAEEPCQPAFLRRFTH